jgi:hypothetical protein
MIMGLFGLTGWLFCADKSGTIASIRIEVVNFIIIYFLF